MNTARAGALLTFTVVLLMVLPAVVPRAPEAARSAVQDPVRLSGTRVSGPISGNVTWPAAGSPYWIEGNVEVTLGSTLSLEPGVRLQFNTGSSLTVRGSLQSLGTSALQVTITTNVTQPTPEWTVTISVYGSFLARNTTMEYGRWLTASGTLFALDQVRYSQSESIVLDGVQSVSIARSSFLGVPRAVQLDNSQSVSILFNEIRTSSAGGTAVWVRTSPSAKVVGNIIDGQFNSGIRVDSPDALIVQNYVARANSGILAGAWNGVYENLLRDNGIGIGVAGVEGTTVARNQVLGSRSAGISVNAASYTNVTANTVVSNRAGIDVVGSSNVTVAENTFRANGRGAWIRQGRSNWLFQNWFIGNEVQASDSSTGTMWDDGYPSGGNHWSDYLGDDLYQGPNQNVPGPDGIGDTARPVGPNGIDRYPFYTVPAPRIPQNLTAQAVGSDVVLTWQSASMADDYILYRADTPTGFDFSSPVSLGNVTSWTDAGAAAAPGARYYVLRARNATWDRAGPTSNTAGKWTQEFTGQMATLSIPLYPYPWVDYAEPGWVDTVGELLAATGGARLGYMDAGRWRYVLGDGDPARSVRVGEGYTVAAPWRVTFTGLPCAMIDYASWPPYPLAGFDPATTARQIAATTSGDDVLLTWTEIPGFGSPGSAYEVYYADAPWKLRGSPWTDYRLLATVPATGGGTASALHAGALAAGTQWFYLVVAVQDGRSRGPSTYSVGVSAITVGPGYAAIGLPLRPYANGTYLTLRVSSLLGPNLTGIQWFDPARGDWVAHAAWMPPGTYDAPFTMVMAVQVDAAVPTRLAFTGV